MSRDQGTNDSRLNSRAAGGPFSSILKAKNVCRGTVEFGTCFEM